MKESLTMQEIRDAIVICLRKGNTVEDVGNYLETQYRILLSAKNYKPNSEVALYAQAIEDSHHAP